MAEFWSWLPLLCAAVWSFGPVANNYGFALYFLTWQHGFVKRGLVGELFAGIPFLSRGDLLLIEYLFLVAAYVAAYIVFRRVIFGSREERLFAALLLSSPAMLPHIGYLFAQPDVTLFLLTLGCLAAWTRCSPFAALSVTTVLASVALLSHEAFSLMFYPLMVAIVWRACRRGALKWRWALVHVFLVCVVFGAVIHFGKLKVSPNTVLAEAQARTNVAVQRQVYDVMASSLGEQLALVHRLYTGYVIHVLVLTVLFSFPFWWLLFSLARRALRADGACRIDRYIFAVCMFSPLLLCALGHDTTRWIGAACADVCLYLLYLFMTEKKVRQSMSEWATGEQVYAWLAYLLLIGPYEATGIYSAVRIYGWMTL
ncbi:MAG: hypothetical protein JSS87_04125 [Acidobacteria bacterium]|nr:hypothetical protein [Acidobacteriota bacterium]